MASTPSSIPPSTVSKTPVTNQVRSWVRAAAHSEKRTFQLDLITTASYVTVGVITVCTITSLFMLFIMVTVLDDVLRIAGPSRLWQATRAHRQRLQLDWAGLIDRASVQLDNFAAWERRKRAEWVSSSKSVDDDSFHSLVSAVSNYLSDYARYSRQRSEAQKPTDHPLQR